MIENYQIIVASLAVPAASFFTVYVFLPPLIRFLESRKLAVKDFNKKGQVMVARPGGPALLAGVVVSLAILYILMPSLGVIAISATTALAFFVGLVDDRRVMGGWFKPVALALSAVPILLLGTYDHTMAFPIFGEVNIPLLYIVVVIFMIPITGNTINSIDVLNGVASGFMVIASAGLTLSLVILQNFEVAIASSSLVFASLAFYKFHKHPSKIFPGDSGALTLGAMYGAISIVGEVEIIAAVALLPAVINSFLFLSSMKRIIEHREIKAKPVEHTDDLELKATVDKDAPVTLVRLILARGPLSEKQVAFAIFKLATFSSILALITALLMGANY